MVSPNLPVTVNSTYSDSSSDPSIGLHQRHHDVIHALVNRFDSSIATSALGAVPVCDGSLFVSRALLATDIPAVVTSTHSSSYSLVSGDGGTTVEMNATAGNTVTVPSRTAVAFPLGTVIAVRQYGAGTTTIRGAAGVSIRSRGGCVTLAGRYAEATLTNRASDEWILVGDVV